MSETNIMWQRELKEEGHSDSLQHILFKSDQGNYNCIVTCYHCTNVRTNETSSNKPAPASATMWWTPAVAAADHIWRRSSSRITATVSRPAGRSKKNDTAKLLLRGTPAFIRHLQTPTSPHIPQHFKQTCCCSLPSHNEYELHTHIGHPCLLQHPQHHGDLQTQ